MFCSYYPGSLNSKEENKNGRYSIEGTNLEFKIHYRFKDIQSSLAPSESIFMNASYQQILEDYPSNEMEFVYIPVYEDGTEIGIIMAQTIMVRGKNAIRLDNNKTWNTWIKKQLLKFINIRGFVVGNLALTGNYGLHFKNKSERETFAILNIITQNALPVVEKEKGYKLKVLFYKDFNEAETAQSSVLTQANYHCFTAEPCMILPLSSDWNSFDDYLAAMSSKYRVRAKRAFKKGKDLKKIEFNEEQIVEHKKELHQLYLKVCESVDFNLMTLDQEYFVELKKRLKEKYKLFAYFLDGKLIAFFTTIQDKGETHAHFLGMDASYNPKYQLYLNILYDIIRVGIEEKSSLIDFARTAPEIKSSVGAEPRELFIFLKHKNTLSNKILKRVYKFLEPTKKVIYRSPFKNRNISEQKTEKTNEEKLLQPSAKTYSSKTL